MNAEEANYLFHEGTYYQSYEYFGAHFLESSVVFRLWAPNALAVSIVGTFNDWDPLAHPMQLMPHSGGIWYCQIDNLQEGMLYKYHMTQCDGEKVLKSDPYAFFSELNPKTASVMKRITAYDWQDAPWQKMQLKKAQAPAPMNIYEVHLGSWRTHKDGTPLSYRELAQTLVPYIQSLHYTHVEFMPIMEYPFGGSWGYQLTGYFSATSRYGKPEDLMYLIDTFHQAGIAVILDWVPGHFCKDAHGLAKFDGTNLYEATEHPQWGTMEFDFGKPEIQSFLISNAHFWMNLYHADGLRIDGVASMLYLNYGYDLEWRKNEKGGNDCLEAVDFLKKLNTHIFKEFPYAIMAAEESTAYPMVTWPVDEGGLGFNYKWNMGWMHDTLSYMMTDPYCRSDFHEKLTFSMSYAFSENFILPLSHDEVVHGKKTILDKMFGDPHTKFDQLRLLYAYMFLHSGKKLNFMGNEFAPFTEWRYYESLEWFLLNQKKHHQLFQYVQHLNLFYKEQPALWEKDHSWEGFKWIDADNTKQSIIIFERLGNTPEDALMNILNFGSENYKIYRVGVPQLGEYELVFNSDQLAYGGQGYPVKKIVDAEKMPFHGQPYSIEIAVPTTSALIYKACKKSLPFTHARHAPETALQTPTKTSRQTIKTRPKKKKKH